VEDPETLTREEQYQINSLKGNVEDLFTSEILSPGFVKASEFTAIQKLNDFADYLRIVADTSFEMRFRKLAADMITSLFIPARTEIGTLKKLLPDESKTTLDELIFYSLSEGLPCYLQLPAISVAEPLLMLNDSTYTGSISFNYNCLLYSVPDTSYIASGKCLIHISLSRFLKPFGSHYIKVWEVKLGDIY
jgi:hypothetical protein